MLGEDCLRQFVGASLEQTFISLMSDAISAIPCPFCNCGLERIHHMVHNSRTFFFFFCRETSIFLTVHNWSDMAFFFFFSMNIRTLGRVDRPLFCSHLSDLMLCDSNFRTLSDLEKKIKLMSKYVWSTFRTDTELDLRCWWFVCFFCFGQNKTQFFSSW